MQFTSLSSFTDLNSCLAQAATAPQGSGIGMQMLIMALIFGGMWFLLIAPQRKKQKQLQAMLNTLQKGDKVLTAAGIFGEITQVKDDRFTVKIAENTTIELSKGAIQAKL